MRPLAWYCHNEVMFKVIVTMKRKISCFKLKSASGGWYIMCQMWWCSCCWWWCWWLSPLLSSSLSLSGFLKCNRCCGHDLVTVIVYGNVVGENNDVYCFSLEVNKTYLSFWFRELYCLLIWCHSVLPWWLADCFNHGSCILVGNICESM